MEQLRNLISTNKRLHFYPLYTATRCNTLHMKVSFISATERPHPLYTATRCNTLHHTAPHCNTLQHTATRCNTLQLNEPLKCSMTHFYVLWLREVCTMTYRDDFREFLKNWSQNVYGNLISTQQGSDYKRLFGGNIGPFRRNIGLFGGNRRLFGGNTGLFGAHV